MLAYERSTTKWHATSGLQFPAVTTVTYAAAIEGQEGRREGEEGQGQGPRQQREEQGRKAQRREAEPAQEGQATHRQVRKRHTCGKQGHFSRDCWRNRPGGKGVHQVQEETASSPSSTATTVAALTQQPAPWSTAATTEIFDISEHRCRLRPGACRPIYFVQMVTATANEDPQMEEEPALIILDSGADASMVPYSFEARGSPARGSPPVLQDCPGATFGLRPSTGERTLCRGERPGSFAEVAFRHNSLALRGHMRAVTLTTPAPAAVRRHRLLRSRTASRRSSAPRMHELPHSIKGHYAANAFKHGGGTTPT